jgi:hypothetical protein
MFKIYPWTRWFLSLVCLSQLHALAESGFTAKHEVSKRDASEEATAIKAIEELAKSIPLTSYDSDPILIQFTDRANSHTTYKDPTNDHVYYERDFADHNTPIVVLSSAEDKLPVSKSGIKRVYIILTASGIDSDTGKKYYPSIAYLA